ncbi:hypothetical protein N7468_008332 [Penicillium chermesinum]|uniref:Uncharacterized protein n=1 Tax=Penicillium chermesinum TaxID=63820 RepID=A0A9W9TJS0_9EURO|nr:uncharacterized protein N7468_008332 [Penicillium chermesinum]KAJ5223790.1 hypothetical protein N7468_008332 [Penicillium chermesinum]KAJ6155384.1 hypothetical protein N7470_005950 [Penicillium chermesinum]
MPNSGACQIRIDILVDPNAADLWEGQHSPSTSPDSGVGKEQKYDLLKALENDRSDTSGSSGIANGFSLDFGLTTEYGVHQGSKTCQRPAFPTARTKGEMLGGSRGLFQVASHYAY